MRIALLTPEYVTEQTCGGGLGNYLFRIAQALNDDGHEVEIFVAAHAQPPIVHQGRIRVERVFPHAKRFWTRAASRMLQYVQVPEHFQAAYLWHSAALAVADAMEQRHAVAPFDIVQSSDYLGIGLGVRRSRPRVHVVRCSSAADLYNDVDGCTEKRERLRAKLERTAIMRADRAYAPSQFIADYYKKQHSIALDVLRPPAILEVEPSTHPVARLPERFFVHFGQLTRRKGIAWLTEALHLVFDAEPAFRLLLIGSANFREIESVLAKLAEHRGKVLVLYPMPKPELYAIVKRADAAVFPSLADNLPNTVIESLLLGIPVIGSKGASIDELVEAGVTGELANMGDVEDLARIIVRFWRRETPVKKGFSWPDRSNEEMRPEKALENFLQFASGSVVANVQLSQR